MQAFEHARETHGVAFEHGFAQMKYVVAGHIEHGLADVLKADRPRRKQQRELLHLLKRRHQIAFDFFGDEGERFGIGLLPLRFQARGQPLRQRGARHGLGFDGDAAAIQRLEPARLLRAPVDFGQVNQCHGIRRQVRAKRLQRRAAFHAGLAIGDAQFQQLE